MALASGAAVLMAGQAAHAGPFNLGDELFGGHTLPWQHAKPPPVGLYRDDQDGDPPFVLDRTSSIVLLRFADSQEIWVLTPQPAPRGDTLYKNDVGEPVLRVTRLGGMTLFTVDHPGGAAAALVGDAQPIRPAPVLSYSTLLLRITQATARSSHALQRLVVFEAQDVTPQSAALVADAAGVTAEAVVFIARHPDGKRALSRLARVMLTSGHKASVGFAGGVLQVVVAPKPGNPLGDITGRPSSRRIELALGQ
ncbi:MAG TPA: DUF4908 domain-containing protein [Caulobacteraceae bacterium]|nr:DUF4908 domain-containing protein [Caulobacteraceae bacterium]